MPSLGLFFFQRLQSFVHGTLNVTFALKPDPKAPFKLPLGRVLAGIFDIFQVLIVLS